jgi:hypothetical protein
VGIDKAASWEVLPYNIATHALGFSGEDGGIMKLNVVSLGNAVFSYV